MGDAAEAKVLAKVWARAAMHEDQAHASSG